MRIAFDHQIFCLQPYGGISRYYVELAKQLFARHQDVQLFAPLHRNQYVGTLPPSIVQGKYVPKYIPKTRRLMMLVNQGFAQRAIRQWRPDILHKTYFSNQIGYDCPVIITVYDMIHELFPEFFSKHDSTALFKKAAIEQADHVICISHSTRNDLLRTYNIDPDKVSVIYLGFDPMTQNHIPDFNTGENKPFLLYVGNRGGYKNFHAFLKAFAASDSLCLNFDIIAFGGGDFLPEEKYLMHELGLMENQVRHIGGDDNMLYTLYKKATALVYPSLYEGFGLPPLEAMACGCPVIASNTSSLPEVIGDAGALFTPDNAEEMTAVIERVVFDRTIIENLKRKGFQRIKRFTWKECAEQTQAVYQQVIMKRQLDLASLNQHPPSF